MERSCSRCGEPVDTEDRFCPRCGWPLSRSPAEPAALLARGPWRTLLWLGVPVVVVLGVLALTNPSRGDYARWLTTEASSHTVIAVNRLPPGRLAAALAAGTVAQNDVIFTIFDTRTRRLQIDVLGILDHFVPLGASPAD